MFRVGGGIKGEKICFKQQRKNGGRIADIS